MDVFLGIDWGGTYIKAGIVNSKGKILRSEVYSCEGLKKKEVFIDKLKSLANSLGRFNIRGVGIGAPGIIDVEKGFIYYLPNITGWKNFPLKDILRNKLNLPVFVDNDANVFALAEARLGAAKGKLRAIFLTLGTGLGGAVIWNGKILEGKTSSSELGHIPLSLEGKLCSCGGRGCIETFVGNKYLLERYKQLKSNKTSVREVKDIFGLALKGEKAAVLVWKEFSIALGKFLAGMVNVFNPQLIVFGGGVAGAFRLFTPWVKEALRKQAMWPQIKGLKIVKAKLKNAGMIGAALLAKEGLSLRG
jgi:glucokinase